jgi:murein DD-endopeptidase MepM/ murein hydrolase activator NlpD
LPKRSCVIFPLLLFLYAHGTPATPDSVLKISHYARALQPGEVVLLTVESPKPLQNASAALLGKTFPLYPGPDARVWQGLIGIDPEARPGRHTVHVSGKGLDGAPFLGEDGLEVRSKIFPTRRLTVDEQYVTPAKEMEERIRRESRRVEDIFAQVTPRRIWKGHFRAPVHAPASSSFGRRTILNGKPRSPHWGTDFTADIGTAIIAPNSGRILLAADLYFSGSTVIIDHGLGLYSFLAHMSQIAVREGDEVEAGALIGRVGATGRATGPHLHWTIRLVGVRVDPLSLIAALAGK